MYDKDIIRKLSNRIDSYTRWLDNWKELNYQEKSYMYNGASPIPEKEYKNKVFRQKLRLIKAIERELKDVYSRPNTRVR